MNTPRILLADDHPFVLAILCQLAGEVGKVVGAVWDGLAAVNEARRLKPDVAVVDLAMSGVGGIQAAQFLRRDLPETKVIICTVHTGKEYIAEAFAAGAVGFVRKQSAYEDLAPAIRAVLAGERFVSPLVLRNGIPSQEAKAGTDILLPVRSRDAGKADGHPDPGEPTDGAPPTTDR